MYVQWCIACSTISSFIIVMRIAWLRREQERDHHASEKKTQQRTSQMQKEKTDFMAVLVHV
jgi:hypothetical protein